MDEPQEIVRVNGVPSVVVSQGLFDAMASCFYGDGPTYGELKGGRKREAVREEVREVEDGVTKEEAEKAAKLVEQMKTQGGPATISIPGTEGMRLRPQGAALKEMMEMIPVEARSK